MKNGRKRDDPQPASEQTEWEVLIKDHHQGYIGWEEFERNQRLIADNANGKSYLGRGSVRRGEALLAGLFGAADAAGSCKSPMVGRRPSHSVTHAVVHSANGLN